MNKLKINRETGGWNTQSHHSVEKNILFWHVFLWLCFRPQSEQSFSLKSFVADVSVVFLRVSSVDPFQKQCLSCSLFKSKCTYYDATLSPDHHHVVLNCRGNATYNQSSNVTAVHSEVYKCDVMRFKLLKSRMFVNLTVQLLFWRFGSVPHTFMWLRRCEKDFFKPLNKCCILISLILRSQSWYSIFSELSQYITLIF